MFYDEETVKIVSDLKKPPALKISAWNEILKIAHYLHKVKKTIKTVTNPFHLLLSVQPISPNEQMLCNNQTYSKWNENMMTHPNCWTKQKWKQKKVYADCMNIFYECFAQYRSDVFEKEIDIVRREQCSAILPILQTK